MDRVRGGFVGLRFSLEFLLNPRQALSISFHNLLDFVGPAMMADIAKAQVLASKT